MIPTRLALVNYGPFQGQHAVDLEPIIYSVIARDAADPERSNWIGKSWFLSAFRFALFGAYPGRTKDRLITDGESESCVELILDDGAIVITRSKKRGSSEQLVVKYGKTVAKQDAAQSLIIELIGFTRADFDATCWVRQKGANGIVVADPAPRTDMITGWMDLQPLQNAAAIESTRLTSALSIDKKSSDQIYQLDALIAAVNDAGECKTRIVGLRRDIKRAESLVAELQSTQALISKWEQVASLEAQLETVIVDGRALKATMSASSAAVDDDRLSEVVATFNEVELRCRAAIAERDRIKNLLCGTGFDGYCPVILDKCLAIDAVQARVTDMNSQYTKAKNVAEKAITDRSAAAAAKTNLLAARENYRVNEGRLAALRDQAQSLLDQIDELKQTLPADKPAGNSVGVQRALLELQEKIGQARGEIASLETQLDNVSKWITEKTKLEHDRSELATMIRTHREAMVVLGRNGAQREIVEGNLATIEAGANSLLSGAGIDLIIRASWGRTGSGLASHCQACGQPFAKSAKEKQCQICGASRGANIVEKLELELNKESDGAAEDVAGLAMQLSAAAWLRRHRQSAWSTMFIDEPFAACDARIGAQLADQLRAMLGASYSFRQAFVVAHNAALTESMPGRISISRALSGKLKIEVQS